MVTPDRRLSDVGRAVDRDIVGRFAVHVAAWLSQFRSRFESVIFLGTLRDCGEVRWVGIELSQKPLLEQESVHLSHALATFDLQMLQLLTQSIQKVLSEFIFISC